MTPQPPSQQRNRAKIQTASLSSRHGSHSTTTTTISSPTKQRTRQLLLCCGTLLKRRQVIFSVVVSLVFVLICVSLNVVFVTQQQQQQQQQQTQHQSTKLHTEPTLLSNEEKTTTTETTIISPKTPLATVAHVVSLIKCNKKASVTGFLDAAAVLRHSIHQQSIHANNSNNNKTTNNISKYSYHMYAIVHESCQENAELLSRLGYTSLVRPSPVVLEDIQPGWYKDHVEGENCCGSAEFIKLYAYTLDQHPIVVHWDLDVALFQPMDDLFDAMLFDKESIQGRQARQRLNVQHPHKPLPDTIDAYFTRDITSAQPWEIRQGVQGGFLVARPNQSQFDQYLQFIKRGNYVGPGRGYNKGWDGLGYGGFQGAMAYQGAVAYFYDQLAPNTAVELDICIWNQVVADVIWRGPDGPRELLGHCREYPTQTGVTLEQNTPENGYCNDCRIVPVQDVKSAHYTACKKPWECTLPYPRKPKQKRKEYKLNELTNVTTCGLLFRRWFDLRRDFEDALERAAGVVPSPRNGKYEPQYFGGYCEDRGRYIPMNPPPPSSKQQGQADISQLLYEGV
ncbi:hypothetical protein IV203_019032 [Nitzschia inconspicua]|uniref:Uncharacterized protein n=1 Tax=Nitzschia inconspicua TaxID=303405 RepID=A0A9K3PF67_9STRA|nr:hypothetical protein IV203_022644 [Nitzschia inconspicua]KAG7370462.1 hypothetical protein IV203_019032 [Nitzschia inconspicua]